MSNFCLVCFYYTEVLPSEHWHAKRPLNSRFYKVSKIVTQKLLKLYICKVRNCLLCNFICYIVIVQGKNFYIKNYASPSQILHFLCSQHLLCSDPHHPLLYLLLKIVQLLFINAAVCTTVGSQNDAMKLQSAHAEHSFGLQNLKPPQLLKCGVQYLLA